MGMHEYLSAGCECEREIAISRVKPETIYWLKISKISDLDNLAIDMGETSTCTLIHYVYEWWLFPKGGAASFQGGVNAPPPKRNPNIDFSNIKISILAAQKARSLSKMPESLTLTFEG